MKGGGGELWQRPNAASPLYPSRCPPGPTYPRCSLLVLPGFNTGKKVTSSSKSPQKATVSHYSTSSFELFDVASPTQTKLFLSQSVLAHEQDVTRTIRSTSSTYLKHICPNSLHFVLYHFSNQYSCIIGTETFLFYFSLSQ